jgi:hypothetical protein
MPLELAPLDIPLELAPPELETAPDAPELAPPLDPAGAFPRRRSELVPLHAKASASRGAVVMVARKERGGIPVLCREKPTLLVFFGWEMRFRVLHAQNADSLRNPPK